ncbi:alpha/beta hydrolase [Paenibacillus eucommiae]|uniref:Acetyl esterase/lipase n=1 Tax=Paenibacillus eucommiae TaxID=1355755 RepID=A0ABS4J380_9BACL|nr:alpha/beta hydrolase [Paenibacillus eucommiae]MBP1994287.1 acetyl esterase/lipase [Paenibacillus eucommiae]
MELITYYYDEDIQLKRALDIARPVELSRRTALFYIHGGGWRGSSRDLYHEHMQYFSHRGYLCASAGYRLVPVVQLPGQMADVRDGYSLFIRYIEENGLTIDRIILIGSSAGAHLASMLAVTEPRWLEEGAKPRLNWRRPTACVSVCGPGTLMKWDNMEVNIKRAIEELLGVTYEANTLLFQQASPIEHVNEQSPDFLFLIAGKEKLFPHPFIYAMSDKLKYFGKRADVVLFPEAEHGFFYHLRSDLQLEALAVLEAYMESY